MYFLDAIQQKPGRLECLCDSNKEVVKKTAQSIWDDLEETDKTILFGSETEVNLYFDIFAKSATITYTSEETAEVSGILKRLVKPKELEDNPMNKMPHVHQYIERLNKATNSATEKYYRVLLSRMCFLASSVYAEYIDHRARRTGLPTVDFYRKTGISAYEACGETNLARNFDYWTQRVRDTLPLSPHMH